MDIKVIGTTLIVDIYFDGACDNNSKLKSMGIGVVVKLNGVFTGKYDSAKFVGSAGSSNIAEYEALTEALSIISTQLLTDFKDNLKVRIYGDSQLVINQVLGEWRCKKEHLIEYCMDAKEAFRALKHNPRIELCTLNWVRRNFNQEADKLSKDGLNKKE